MRGVDRTRLVVVALFAAVAVTGCAAGEDDPVEPTETPMAKTSAARKVFRESSARPPLFQAIDGDKLSMDGSDVPSPSPIREDMPLPPRPEQAGEEAP